MLSQIKAARKSQAVSSHDSEPDASGIACREDGEKLERVLERGSGGDGSVAAKLIGHQCIDKLETHSSSSHRDGIVGTVARDLVLEA